MNKAEDNNKNNRMQPEIKNINKSLSQRKDILEVVKSSFNFELDRAPVKVNKVSWDVKVAFYVQFSGRKMPVAKGQVMFGKISNDKKEFFNSFLIGNGILENSEVIVAFFNPTDTGLKKLGKIFHIKKTKFGTWQSVDSTPLCKKIAAFFGLKIPLHKGEKAIYYFSLTPVPFPKVGADTYIFTPLTELNTFTK